MRLWQELAAEKAMVFMAGPRQVGKTTLAREISAAHANKVYLNWDVVTDRSRLLDDAYFFQAVARSDESRPLVVLDEIHKYRDWKNYLKGAYDRFHREYRFLVTGSGRLDAYRKGGDSLAGRYALFHLWPLTLAELLDHRATLEDFRTDPLGVVPDEDGRAEDTWRRLGRFSGFPEPYVRARPTSYRRWSRDYHSQLIREDIRDLTGIKAIGDVETLFSLLPERVGSPLSITSLKDDLKVAYNTVKSWMNALARFYLTFSVTPWTRRVVRAIHKASKVYLFDYAVIEDRAARFENMVALELFRAVSTWNDLGHGPFGLHLIRNKEGEEVDFLLTEKRRPLLLVEAKSTETRVEPRLAKFQEQLRVPAVQLTDEGSTFRKVSGGAFPALVAPAYLWLPRLP
jgi:predicted AAA+ superfamily ATPase